MKQYEAYQSSGSDWIGAIPRHWPVVPLKREADLIAGQSPKSEDCNENGMGLPFLQGCAEFGDKNPNPKQHCEFPPKRSQEGDILLSVRAPVGEINRADQPYGIGRGLCAVRSASGSTDYLSYLLESASSALHSVATGTTYKAVSTEQIGNVTLPHPPRDEQIAIAAFLDHETGKIDCLIAEQERLIALLDEKRQAVISYAVTKGLDPNVEMKDSGIEWLGEVPAQWQLKTIKSLARIKGGSTPDATGGHWDGDVVWYSPSDLTGDTSIYASSSARKITAAGVQSCSTNITPAGSVVLSTRAPIGSVKISSVDSCTNQGCKTLVPIETSAEYLYYVLLSATKELNLRGRGTTFLEISGDALGSLVIPVPPKDERDLIVETLSHEMGVMRTLQDESRVMLSLLKERRSALISSAVTGKIDVRNHPAAVAALNENKD